MLRHQIQMGEMIMRFRLSIGVVSFRGTSLWLLTCSMGSISQDSFVRSANRFLLHLTLSSHWVYRFQHTRSRSFESLISLGTSNSKVASKISRFTSHPMQTSKNSKTRSKNTLVSTTKFSSTLLRRTSLTRKLECEIMSPNTLLNL